MVSNSSLSENFVFTKRTKLDQNQINFQNNRNLQRHRTEAYYYVPSEVESLQWNVYDAMKNFSYWFNS
jgi:hypothetical protein